MAASPVVPDSDDIKSTISTESSQQISDAIDHLPAEEIAKSASSFEDESNDDEDEKEWELEEDVMRFLKTVALHRCVTGVFNVTTPIKLLDDILLVCPPIFTAQVPTLHCCTQNLEVLEGLPREYVVGLRQRLLVDVLWFFRDNNIASSSTLLLAFQKYPSPLLLYAKPIL